MGRLGKTLVSVGSILIVAVVGILIYCYWPAITGTVNNNKYYTQEDVQKAYDDGYADGNKSESELTTKYEYYKSLVDDYYVQVTTLNEEINKLSNENASYSTQVKNLTTQKTNLQAQVDNLTSIKEANESTITDLNNQITNLQSQVKNLTNSGEDKSEQIANLNTQITNLQNTVSQLQTTNKMNLDTITSLNNQISSLNAQISEMTENSQNYTGKINALNSKISELQKSIAYYEAYIAQLENTEQVVATFEFDGSVYNIQIVNKGSKLSVVTPTSTEYKIFNGWTVNGQAIDLNTFTITTNTKIVADITYKFDVKFKVDDEFVSNQVIVKDNFATLPSNPTKEGYKFDGWSLNGVNVISDIEIRPVIENTTYIAVFTKLHTVTFVANNNILETKKVRNGEYVSNFNKDYTWTLNDITIDFTNYAIFADVTFVGNLKDLCGLKKLDYGAFDGVDGFYIWTDGVNDYYSNGTKQYAFDKVSNSWKTKLWYGFDVFSASYIWTDGTNIYYSYKEDQYILNKETSTWIKKDWNDFMELKYFWGSHVWTDGENVYFSESKRQYVLNKTTGNWETKTWIGYNVTGLYVWTDGLNYYYSNDKNQYVLDRATNTWNKMSWNGLNDFSANDVWTDGKYFYYSNVDKQYVLDKDMNTWKPKTWNGTKVAYGKYVWTDGVNYYYLGGRGIQYIFVRSYEN